MTLSQLNFLSRDEFIRIVGPVFEHSPWIAEVTWPMRPFASVEEAHEGIYRRAGERGVG
jgi:2-oxo-4-hydroxy-4-carboxy-5-ureidoimidazoline decarboxylase